MRKLLIIIAIIFIANFSFAQKYKKLYNQATGQFKLENFKEADSLYSKAISKAHFNNYDNFSYLFFDRGVTRLYLTDTCGFCSDMLSAMKYRDRVAMKYYKALCIKCNEKANKYYNQGFHEFTLKNYKASDSLLTLSIKTYEFADNVYLRGLAKLYMLDTNSFCSDMERIYDINDQAKQDYDQICSIRKSTNKASENLQTECMNNGDKDIFFVVENMPKFNGSNSDAFRIFIQQNLRYPLEAHEKGITGRVFVQFDICKNGELKNAVIVRSAGELLDNEVLRILSLSPKWSPGLQRNKPVTVRFTFPVVFQIQ